MSTPPAAADPLDLFSPAEPDDFDHPAPPPEPEPFPEDADVPARSPEEDSREVAIPKDVKSRMLRLKGADLGAPERSNASTMLALDWLGLGLAMDTRAGRVVARGDVSALRARFPRFSREWSQESLLALRAFLIEVADLDVPLGMVQEAAQTLALRAPFDPVAEWLDSLRWDGVRRLDLWLIRYAGAEDSEYVRAVGRRLLLAAVARALAPGIKFDSMVVLEGEQGAGKSSLVRIMGGSYTVEDLPRDVAGKDTVDALRTAWWVEVSELASMQRSEMDDFKSFVSRTVDRARLAYEREARDFPRRCVLVGTTNDSAYLQDSTGNRRFWPVRIGTIDLAALERDREQLYAEAVREWRADPRPAALELPKALWPAAAAEQESRHVSDPWLETIARHVQAKPANEIATADLFELALRMKPEQQNTGHARRLARVMQALGWEKAQVGPGSKRQRGYRRRLPS